MNKKKILAISSIALAIIIIIGVMSFAGPCPVAAGEKPMKCNWTVEAVKGIAVVMALSGLAKFAFSEDNSKFRGIAIVEVLNGLYSISLVTFLIGTCMHEEMICNLGLKPFVIVVGGIYTLLAVFSYITAKDN